MKEQLSKIFGFNDKHQVDEVQQVSVNQIRPNPYQPRTVFEDERLTELAQTIKTHGVIQPIIVRIRDDMFEIIAGERRWRAVKKLGLETIPVIVREFNDAQSASIALIENLQREGLTAIEEASAYKRLMELHDLTQESLAQRLGKGQSTIANKIRLLHSTAEVKQALLERKISERHARALLSVEDEQNQNKLLNEIIEMQLTIKQTETRIPFYNGEYKRKAKKRISFTRDIRLAVNTIRESLGIIKKSGIKIETEEHESEEYLQIVVKIPKK